MALSTAVVTAATPVVDNRTQSDKLLESIEKGTLDVNITRGAARSAKERYLTFTFGDGGECKIPLGQFPDAVDGEPPMSLVRAVCEGMNGLLTSNLSQLPSMEELVAAEAAAAPSDAPSDDDAGTESGEGDATPDEPAVEVVEPTKTKRSR